MRPLVVFGNLTFDRIGGGEPRPGGGPFHGARALRALNRPAAVVARCSIGDRSVLLPPLVRLGIPVLWREAASTARFTIDYEGEERRMAIEELGDPWCPADVAATGLGSGAGWAHVAPLTRSEFPPATLAALAARHRVSFDGQGLVRPARTGPVELDAEYDRDVMGHLSILKLAEAEAHVLIGDPTEEALRSLGVPEVVVTLGSRGSIVYADGLAEHVPARAVGGGPDPTGAGDAFAVSYLLARSGGFSAPAAARWASGAVAGLLSGRIR